MNVRENKLLVSEFAYLSHKPLISRLENLTKQIRKDLIEIQIMLFLV